MMNAYVHDTYLARPGLNYPEKRRCVTTAMHECSVHAHVLITVPCIVHAVCVFLVALIKALTKRKLRKENMAHNERDLFLRFSSNSS